jgi:hypothetical protein
MTCHNDRMAYSEKQAARAALEASQRDRDRVTELERAIREHYHQVHARNWGADDDLWAVVGLEANPEVIG